MPAESLRSNKGLPSVRVPQRSFALPFEKLIPSKTAVASKGGAL